MRKKKTVVERNIMIFVLSDIEFVNLNEAQLEILTLNLIFTLVLNQICFSIIKLEIKGQKLFTSKVIEINLAKLLNYIKINTN